MVVSPSTKSMFWFYILLIVSNCKLHKVELWLVLFLRYPSFITISKNSKFLGTISDEFGKSSQKNHIVLAIGPHTLIKKVNSCKYWSYFICEPILLLVHHSKLIVEVFQRTVKLLNAPIDSKKCHLHFFIYDPLILLHFTQFYSFVK